MIRHLCDLRALASALATLVLLSVHAPSVNAEEFETPAGLTAQLVGGISLAFDTETIAYDPGIRIGGTVGYELELQLPWRTSLTPQFTLAWNTWRFSSPLNEGAHSIFLAMVGVTYTQYRPFKVRNVSMWSSIDLGLGSSSVEYDGFIGTNAMKESHSGLAFRFQAGTAYHLLPYLALGLYLDIASVGLEELTALSFSASSFDAGLVLRGRFPL